MRGAIRRGEVSGKRGPTVRQAGVELIEGMRSGVIREDGGKAFKPSVCKSYERALPLRVIYRRAVRDELVAVNPTRDLDMPRERSNESDELRTATPEEARRLLAALRPDDRVIWALDFYAGPAPRRDLALRWRDVDLAASADPKIGKGRIRVERAWCSHTHVFTAPKSAKGRRATPMMAELRRLLFEHRGRLDDPAEATGDALVVTGRFPGHPASASMIGVRGKKAWRAAGLEGEPITLHQARHTYATLAIAAGVGFKSLQTYMGHSSITVTLDRYSHLLPDQADQDAALFDGFLASRRARLARGPGNGPVTRFDRGESWTNVERAFDPAIALVETDSA